VITVQAFVPPKANALTSTASVSRTRPGCGA
jgi:hypothetical protein